ncbi:NDR1/HIN1-like protein 13 [Silene latifolia]|uniref:NDR1/HIN1-like protein 13 n=1 Tax=Silene latifolia TaxID=37657 RepID=UPI003D77DE8D
MYSGQHMAPPPNYAMAQNPYGVPPQPYYHPQQPYYHQHRAIPQYQRRRSGFDCCIRCICCIYFLMFMLIFILLASLFLVFTFYQPRIPYYKIEDFSVTTFNFQPDMSLKTEFQVTIHAENPNTKIGFIYGSDNSITISFQGKIVSSGKMPEFHQEHLNITSIKIPLTGKTDVGSNVYSDFIDREHMGNIPLLVQVKVPVTFVLDNIPLRQFIFRVDCRMTVDDLRPDKKPKIISTDYTFSFGL